MSCTLYIRYTYYCTYIRIYCIGNTTDIGFGSWIFDLSFFMTMHGVQRKRSHKGGGSYRRVREKPHRPQARVDGSIRITVHEMVIVFPHMMFHNIIKGQNTIYAYYRYITEDTGILMGEINSIMYSLYLNNILKIICKNVISLQYYN